MKSSRQRRHIEADELASPAHTGVVVEVEHLAPFNSYGEPDFVTRGYYVDKEFTCEGCGRADVWTARQQKWWYEVAKGFVYSDANYCRACRRRERERREEARRFYQEGLDRKEGGKRS